MRTARFLVAAIALAPRLSPVLAQPGPQYDQPLGIAMETWPYPHPVHYLDVTAEGQKLRMAYMDVPPAGDATRSGGGSVPPAAVLLHGKNFHGGYWEGTIAQLTAAGFRVVVPDQIGFGKSSKPDLDYSFDFLAANTAALLDRLEIRKAAIVGHSMGGMLAVRFARNYPDRTTRLVLENPIGLEDYRAKGVPPTPTEELFAQELAKSGESVRKYVQGYFVRWKPEYEQLVEPHVRVMGGGEYPRWAKSSALTYQMIYQQPVRHEFPLVRVPTLLVIGQEDRTAIGKASVPPEVAKTMGNYPELGKAAARDIPGSELIELPGVGHIPHIESPERFHDALRQFLTAPPPKRPL
jgi:pimeloyl-ACP methyl ester carboxylesterase